MKELETHLQVGVNAANRIELNVKKQQEIEYVLEGTITPKKSHTLWEINEETLDIKAAEYKRDTVAFGLTTVMPPKKLIVNLNCVYIPALNKDNAKKKYLQNNSQSTYYDKEAPMKLSDITFN